MNYIKINESKWDGIVETIIRRNIKMTVVAFF
jgi:hypothetical protein